MSRYLGVRGWLVTTAALAWLAGCAGSAPSKPTDGGAAKDGGGDSSAGGSGGGAAGDSGGGGTIAVDGGSAGAQAGTNGAAGGAAGTGANQDGGTDGPDAASTDGGAAADGGTVADGGAAGAGGTSGGAAGAAGTAGTAGGYQPPAGALTFDVSTDVDPVAPGGRVRYSIKVGNVSTHAVDAVTVSLLLPVGLQFHYANDSEPNTSCANQYVCNANTQATWALGTLSAGQSRTISVNGQVLQDVGNGESITTSFKLTATAFNTVSFTKTVQVSSQASSQLATGTATYPLTAGQRFTLDIDLGQLGMTALSTTTLETTLAPGLTVASISDGGTQATPTSPVAWTIGTVGVGLAVHRQLDVTVDANVPGGALLKARSVLKYDGGLAVDAASEYVVAVVAAAPPVSVAVAATTNPVVPGARVGYRVTISNLGTRAIDGLTLFFPVPAGLSFHYANDAQPNASCANSYVCTADLETFWTVGTVAAGATATYDVSATVVDSEVGNGNLIRTSFMLTGTTIPELEVVKTVQVFDSPRAQLTFTATANPITSAQAFTYDLDIGQIGATPLASTELRARLPAGLTVGTISDGGSQSASGDIVWTIGAVAVGTTLRRTIAVTGDGSAAAGTILKASASLTYDGGAAVDNLVGYNVPVIAAAQLVTLSVSASPNPAVPGSRDLYTATITNTSARAIDGVGLYLRVPDGIQFHYANDSDPDTSCANAYVCVPGLEAFWTLGTLAAGASQMVTVNAEVLSTLVSGSLVPTSFWLYYTGQVDATFVDFVVPTHP
jgi:uncharacterized repeat protein (TIGR01451 family)